MQTNGAALAQGAASGPSVNPVPPVATRSQVSVQVVASGIQDDPQNRTRFLAVGAIETLPSGNDKTSIILAVPNRAGAVYDMLAPLAANKVSMTRLESRPARTGQWEYYFYVDLQGHRNEPAVAQALADLKKQVAFFKVPLMRATVKRSRAFYLLRCGYPFACFIGKFPDSYHDKINERPYP